MSNVSAWSPIDENNNAPPPDGWPEFMMPSQVNNSARAMQGAIRRMYDQMIAGSLALPYVPIAGGTITGSLTVNGALVGGSVTSNSTLYSASTISTGGAINAAGNVSGSSISTAGALSAGSISAGNTSVGGMNASHYDMASAALARVSAASTLLYDRANVWCLQMGNGGTSNYANNVHSFYNRGSTVNYGNWSGGGLTVNDNINAGGEVAGNTLRAVGNISGGWFYSSGLQFGNNGGRFWTPSNIASDGAVAAAAHLDAGNGNLYVGGLHVYNNSGWWNFDNSIYSVGQVNSGGNSFGFGWGGGNGAIWSDGTTISMSRQLTVSGQVSVDGAHLGGNGIRYFEQGVAIGFRVLGSDTGVYYDGGYIYTISTSSSDERLKANIVRSEIDALGLVRQLDTIAYDMHGRHHAVGVRGQQLAELMPDAVTKGPEDAEIPELIQVNPLAFSTYLLRALQQLAAKVDQLEAGGGHE